MVAIYKRNKSRKPEYVEESGGDQLIYDAESAKPLWGIKYNNRGEIEESDQKEFRSYEEARNVLKEKTHIYPQITRSFVVILKIIITPRFFA